MAEKASALYQYKGVFLPRNLYLEHNLKALETFDVREDDIYVLTYTRSGTTLTQQMVSLIMGHEDIQSVSKLPLRERVPFLDVQRPGGDKAEFEILQNRQSPRIIKTHLPVHMAPRQMFEKNPRIIHVIRNPKDTLVSQYHFSKAILGEKPFSEYVDDFLQGEVLLGSWFDHSKGWLVHKDEKNVFLVHYEDILKDLKGTIRKIADFILPNTTLNEDKIDKIVSLCTFDSMSKDPILNSRSSHIQVEGEEDKLIRKGSVGDWKNVFTVAENERFDAVYREKMKGVDIRFEAAGL